jgi:hypothetical protein
MFAGLLSLFRFFIQFAYPIHDALTSYQKQNEKGFAVLVKYFFMTTLLLLVELLLKPLFDSGLFQLFLLAASIALVYNDYGLSETTFDQFEKRYAKIGGSKIEKLVNIAAEALNKVLKWFTRNVYKPVKFFVRKQVHRFFTKQVLGPEPDEDSEPETFKKQTSENRADDEPKPKGHKKRLS